MVAHDGQITDKDGQPLNAVSKMESNTGPIASPLAPGDQPGSEQASDDPGAPDLGTPGPVRQAGQDRAGAKAARNASRKTR
jgi:hypothetical protein